MIKDYFIQIVGILKKLVESKRNLKMLILVGIVMKMMIIQVIMNMYMPMKEL